MPELARLTDADAALTAALGRSLGLAARPGQSYLLDGPLGSGKTHLARAFIRARLGNPAEEVPSPSFTLVQTYDDPAGGASIWHADLYRLSDASETAELGLDEAHPRDIRLVEWPDRLAQVPGDALWITFAPGSGPELREIALTAAAGDWTGAARAADQASFLAGAGWAEADFVPLAGDASSRRYLRACCDGDTAVLMDAPPGSQGPYIAMTGWLRDRGFHAPQILAADPEAGFLLLEDLGDALIARVLEADPSLAPEAYARITDLLAALHRHPPAPGIPALDGPELARQVGLFAEWYGSAAGGPPDHGPGIAAAIETLHARFCADTPPVTGLRDFHAENIVWRGDAPLGLLDFQDAVAIHPAYDLVSALQDVRRDVAPEIERAALDRYLAATGVADPQTFAAAYALLGAQRNLRILGIFARLCLRDGKPRYLAMMPQAWAHLQRDLAHPALAPLAEALAGFPAPTPDLIDRLRARCPTP